VFFKHLTRCAKIKMMVGKIFAAFLIIVVAAVLFMIPSTEMVYDFRTEQRTDTFLTITAAATTSANETLLQDLYGDDMGSVDIDSDFATDAPLPNSYNSTSRVLNITGLTANTTRALDITYDVSSLGGYDAIDTLLDRFPYFWLLVIIAFAPAALVAMFINRN